MVARHRMLAPGVGLAALLSLAPLTFGASSPQIVSTKKIWDRGAHNAFTDLIRFKGHWYCTFREGDDHVSAEGRIRVLASSDGEEWESAALLPEPGIDLRDPKLSEMPDGRLMLLSGGSVMKDNQYVSRQPRVSFSHDGRNWTASQSILTPNHWLWRVTWFKGKGYGVSYLGGGGLKEQREAFLYVTSDGLHYDLITRLEPAGIGETTLRFTESGEMISLARAGKAARIGVRRPPYRDWQWEELPHMLVGPNFIMLPEGRWVAGSRQSDNGQNPQTVLTWMTRNRYEPFLQLPSGGDTSYPGMVWHNNLLWVSYYSSHEGKTSIYLARVRLPPSASAPLPGQGAGAATASEWVSGAFADRLGPAPRNGGFRMDGYWVWCGSVIKGEDGRFHMFASRWPKQHPFFEGYIFYSEVVRASSDRPEGPFRFEEVVLPARGEHYWDGRMTHNPTIHKAGATYLLYYIGSTYPGASPDAEALRSAKVRSDISYRNIRIGLATARSIRGPWTRRDRPVLEPRPGRWDSQIVTNPAACVVDDGSVLLMYRSNTPAGLRLGIARARHFEGPYLRLRDEPVLQFPGGSHVEDPYIWWARDHFELLAKDMTGGITGEKHAGVHATSHDALEWQLASPPLAFSRTITWDDGSTTTQGALERPQLLIENGVPTHLFAATADGPGGFRAASNTWNMVIPIRSPGRRP